MEAQQLANCIATFLEGIEAAFIGNSEIFEDLNVTLDCPGTLILWMELDKVQVRVAK